MNANGIDSLNCRSRTVEFMIIMIIQHVSFIQQRMRDKRIFLVGNCTT